MVHDDVLLHVLLNFEQFPAILTAELLVAVYLKVVLELLTCTE